MSKTTEFDLSGILLHLRDPLDNGIDMEYTTDEAETAATLIFAQASKLLRQEQTTDEDLTDAALLFLSIVKLYLPTYRRDYAEFEDTEEH